MNLIFVSSHRFLFVVLFIKHCIPPASTINFSSCLQRLRSTRYVDRIKSQSVERARNLFITMMIDGYVAAHQKPKTSSMIQSIASNWYRNNIELSFYFSLPTKKPCSIEKARSHQFFHEFVATAANVYYTRHRAYAIMNGHNCVMHSLLLTSLWNYVI